MHFNLTNRNAFKDFVSNCYKIHRSSLSDKDKLAEYKNLYKLLSPRLSETERFLTSTPAFAKRAVHWNQLDVSSIKAVKTNKNPWLNFKREFASAVNGDESIALRAISVALAWFDVADHKNDWLAD